MNKNGIIIGMCGIVLTGLGYGLYKAITKKSEEPVEEVKEEVKETSTKDDNFMDKMMAEYEEDSKATENWDRRSEACKKEMSEKKKSIKDMDVFEDKVSETSEFAAINAMREAAGKEPLEIPKEFEKFLGVDLNKAEEILNKCSAKNKEAIDNIAEGIKKDPKLKKKILDILQE